MIEVIASGAAGFVFLIAAAYSSVVDAILDRRKTSQAAQESSAKIVDEAADEGNPPVDLSRQADCIVDEGQ